MAKTNTNGRAIAIVACIFLFGMISFVTNLAAPIGVIWKNQPEIGGSNMLGMMGNFMNFFAYLFMGIPAGTLLTKIGYKKTALMGIAFGFFGVLVQFLSGFSAGMTGFIIYLAGAFVSGISVCLLNTVVNPMLNQLGGGGNRGNQLNLIGGTFNSLLVYDSNARGCSHRHSDQGHRNERCQPRALYGHGRVPRHILRAPLCPNREPEVNGW